MRTLSTILYLDRYVDRPKTHKFERVWVIPIVLLWWLSKTLKKTTKKFY